MRNKTILLLAAAAFAASSVVSAQENSGSKLISFAGAAQPIAKLKGEKAVVYDSDGEPLFIGDHSFIFAHAKNAGAKVYQWNAAARSVRISGPEAPAAWLKCDELQAMEIACSNLAFAVGPDGNIRISEAARRPGRGPTRGFSLPKSGGGDSMVDAMMRGVPNCPGDPRCPK